MFELSNTTQSFKRLLEECFHFYISTIIKAFLLTAAMCLLVNFSNPILWGAALTRPSWIIWIHLLAATVVAVYFSCAIFYRMYRRKEGAQFLSIKEALLAVRVKAWLDIVSLVCVLLIILACMFSLALLISMIVSGVLFLYHYPFAISMKMIVTHGVGLIIGVYLMILFCLHAPLILFDEKGPIRAILLSAKLIWHNWWLAFFMLCIGMLPLIVCNQVVLLWWHNSAALQRFFTLLIYTVTVEPLCIVWIFATLLTVYHQLKVRKHFLEETT